MGYIVKFWFLSFSLFDDLGTDKDGINREGRHCFNEKPILALEQPV